MITQDTIRDLMGRQAHDAQGEKIGKIGQVYVDERSGEPSWATVNTGLFGMKESFVPLDRADLRGDEVTLGVTKAQVKDAPHVGETADHLSSREEDALRRHYGVGMAAGGPAATDQTGMSGGRSADRTAGRDTDRADLAGRDAGRRDGRAEDGSMTRSEERLRVGTESVEAGHVRLRKYVVTEDQQITVPVSHEEVRIEREPIAEGERVRSGARIGEETREVTLHAERPVVDKVVEAVEKVRLGTRTVTEEQTVQGQIRKEQIEVEDPQHALSADRDRDARNKR